MGETSAAAAAPGRGITVRYTAYGRAAYRALREVVAAAKAADPLDPVTLVVPTNLSGTIARRTLARDGLAGTAGAAGPGSGIAGITVLTLDRLAELVGAATLAARGRRPTTNPVLTAAWRRELDEDPLGFEPVADHPATVTALVEAHRALRDLSPAALGAVSAAGRLPADVVALHRRVAERLAARWYDVHDLRAAARGVLMAGRAPHRLGTVVLFLPQDLDRSSAELVSAVARGAPVVVLAGRTGVAEADRGVLRGVRLLGASAAAQVTAEPPVPAAASTVLHASDSDDEVRCVVREVFAALDRTPAHRIAILYGNATPYARLLHEQCAAAGIEVNGPGVRPTAERVLARAFTDLLALPAANFGRAAVLRLLSSGAVRDGEGRLVPSARWERISRSAGVVSGADWERRLRRYAAEHRAKVASMPADSAHGTPARAARAEAEACAAESLLAFVEDLRRLLAAGTGAGDWRTLATWALDAFHAVLGGEEAHRRLPEAEARAGARIERLLQSLPGLDAVEPATDFDTLRQVVGLELADDLGRTGTFGTGVLVAPLSAAVGLDTDLVFVVGLAEGSCPAHGHEDALLSDEVRACTAGELPALRERLDRQHRHLLAALSAAPVSVASFPRGDLRRSSQRIPSRWLLPTLRALTGDPELAATEWDGRGAVPGIVGSPSFASSVTATGLPATEQEWRLRALVSAGRLPGDGPDDAALARAIELSAARRAAAFTRFDGDLSAYSGELPDYTDGTSIVSPTALEAWAACPHGYFVMRLLGVQPVEQPEELLEMSPLDRGSLLHEALDRFFDWITGHGGPPGPQEAWTESQRRALARIGGQVADEFEQRGVTGHPTMWARDRLRLLDDLVRVLDQDERVRSAEQRRQLRSELEFGKGKAPEPVAVPLPDGRAVRFRGAADRVDETACGALVVTDYKSGKTSGFQGLGEDDPVMSGTKLQLPVYALAARQRLGRPDAEVRAEYWFIGRRDAGRRIALPLTPAVQARHAEAVTTIVDGIRAGTFPAHAPDDSWNGRPICPYCDPDGLGAKDGRDQWAAKKFDPKLRAYLALADPDALDHPEAETGPDSGSSTGSAAKPDTGAGTRG